MTSARPARRVLIAAASLTALLAAAACGGSGETPAAGGSSAPAVDLTKKGPIEYWQGKDTSGNVKNIIAAWNKDHPDEQVTLRELPDNADQQRQQMIQNTQIKDTKMAVLSVDNVWTAEFAANGYIVPLPADQFPTDDFVPATVNSGTYFNKLYAYPTSSDGGLLYYRKDLLDKYDLQPPTTFDEMKAACKTIKDGEGDAKLNCFAGQYQKYEGLTVNFAEAVNSAGGVIVGEDGKANVNTPEAKAGLDALSGMFADGTIPKGAITWQEEQGRQAFQDGELIFHRNWPYVYALAQKTDGSSKVAGKFDVAALPGISGPGVSSLGGHNFGIAANAENKGTAADFIKYFGSAEVQKSNALATSAAPTRSALYSDPDMVKKYPYMPILLKSIETAQPRPKAVKYGDVTLAIQDAAYGTLQGQQTSDAALSGLQTKLEGLIQ
ncbi:ABC transporter substrate-binding protein [Microlunatus capsulatus]|uniref:Multiple sugar transport system substrate-binding protein n=1 Tax=Microlunatus capsulatus TaxID=99117 RepID=A0ABS4Z5H1_9ACTN|nr:ABC transporter substrate-binding protein [Microlunatus capsulatus]MBP2416282.1 multiple sugar transport system substrate-binding protein [Microlunatus capsulatus]